MRTPDYRSGLVALDYGPVITAEWDDANRWNGWLCPRMDAHSVVTILEWLADPTASASVDDYATWTLDDAGVFLVTFPHLDTDDGDPYEATPDSDGLYALGAWGWCWSEFEWPHATIVEARCTRCHEVFNPHGPDDQIHAECGGLGIITGWSV